MHVQLVELINSAVILSRLFSCNSLLSLLFLICIIGKLFATGILHMKTAKQNTSLLPANVYLIEKDL